MRIEKWEAGAKIEHPCSKLTEILVLEGEAHDGELTVLVCPRLALAGRSASPQLDMRPNTKNFGCLRDAKLGSVGKRITIVLKSTNIMIQGLTQNSPNQRRRTKMALL